MPPSHHAAGVFIIGVLLFVLLPLCLRPQMRSVNDSNKPGLVRTSLVLLANVISRSRYPIWVAAGITTGTGRVLADAHWVTDTLAGALLGVALVSLTAMISTKRT